MNYSYKINIISGEIVTKKTYTGLPYTNWTFVCYDPDKKTIYAESNNSIEEAKGLAYLECVEQIGRLRAGLNFMEGL